MAIATMKRLTILSEPSLLKHMLIKLQEAKKTQITPFDQLTEEEIRFFKESSLSQESFLNTKLRLEKVNDAIDFLEEYASSKSWQDYFKEKPIYSLKELNTVVEGAEIDSIVEKTLSKRSELSSIEDQIQTLKEEETFIRQWSTLDIPVGELQDLAYFVVYIGTIPSEQWDELEAQKKEKDGSFFIDPIFKNDDQSGVMIVTDKEHGEQVAHCLKQVQFSPLDYPYEYEPRIVLKQLMQNYQILTKQDLSIRQDLKKAKDDLSLLYLAQEYLLNQLAREQSASLIINSEHLMIVQAWLDEKDVSSVVKDLKDSFNDQLALFIHDATQEDIEENIVPTKLENNRFNQPFENLTLQYGVPHYNSIDPTPYFSLFQVLFFGLMSADVGYGLLLFISTFIMGRMTTLSNDSKKTLKMFNYCSIGTILVGLFFGSFFGYDLPFRVMNLSDSIIEIMISSVAIGLVHMLIAYALRAYLALRQKDYVSVYLDSVQWMLILVGVIILAINVSLNQDILNTIGLILVIGNILGMFVVNIFATANKFIGLGKGLFGLMDVASLVGDLVSYTRLTALGVAGANIAMGFNLIVGMLPPIARFTVGILLFIVLHGLNIFITYLGAYVHSMRLQFVEFFGKFYEAGGQLFTPLRPAEKHITIKKEN